MTRVRDFVADLLRGGTSAKEAKKLADSSFGDKSLKMRAIFDILKLIKEGKSTEDRRKSNPKKTVRTAALIAAVAADVEADRRICVKSLASAHGTSVGTIFAILHEDLGLVKKSARWVPKLLSQEQMDRRVETSAAFVKLIQDKGKCFLGKIITMDESAVSMHTPTTKMQSKQWLKKGTPGPIKAKVAASRTKQMVLAFFDNKGVIYTNYVPRGATVNGDYIIKAWKSFLKALRLKRPDLEPGEWMFHWDNAPVHTAEKVQRFLAKKQIQVIPHPPYSPDLAPADYFLFPTLKRELAGLSMTLDEFKTKWEGVIRTLTEEDFARAFARWQQRCEKCIRIGGGYVEKS
jgi:histone-lysine N-methyltransferase SETMAR